MTSIAGSVIEVPQGGEVLDQVVARVPVECIESAGLDGFRVVRGEAVQSRSQVEGAESMCYFGDGRRGEECGRNVESVIDRGVIEETHVAVAPSDAPFESGEVSLFDACPAAERDQTPNCPVQVKDVVLRRVPPRILIWRGRSVLPALLQVLRGHSCELLRQRHAVQYRELQTE